MNDRPFPEYQKQNHAKVIWDQKRQVHGYDTETYKGKAILICDEGSYIEPSCIEDCLIYLTRRETRSANNFFFNIKFDYAAIMKWFDNDLFEELINTSTVTYGEYSIKYIPQKLLSIRTTQRNTSQYYDLTNFYHGSLKANMQERLDIRKFGTVDANLINSSYGYYGRNREQIIKYCLRDALGAKQLGDILQENYYKSLKIYPRQYISTANITAHYYKSQAYIPSINEIYNKQPKILEYYWKAYMGGRFEVLRKGYFDGPVYDYDLKSAYPAKIATLLNINQGEWQKVDQVNKDAYYGVYQCKVGCPEGHIMPFGYRNQNRITYPQNYQEQPNFLTKGEIFTYQHDCNIEVVDGWEFYPDKIIMPFKSVVNKLYQRKEEIKKEFGKDSAEYDVSKKSLNTYYGKTVNINDEVMGTFWNPIYGAEITQDCRCEVYKQAKEAGSSLIAIETDGIWTDEEIPGIKLGDNLGNWSVDKYPWLFLAGSGQLASEGVLRTRGTPRKKVSDLVQVALKNPEKTSVKFKRRRPVGMKESLILNRMKLEDVNVWHTFTTSIGCNGDKGRKWDKWDYTFGELMKDNFMSEPWGGK